MKWINTTVGEYCPFIYGKGLAQAKRTPGSVPVFGSNGCIDYHSESYVKGPGIIIGRKGSVGAVHISTVPFWPIDTAFYVEKENLEELQFTYFLLKSLGLEFMNSDSAVPGLNRENAHALPIRIPEKEEDRARLGRWISVFNKKIDLNNQTNQTLEAVTQAIFKSWFVDFDPVKAKAQLKSKLETEGGDWDAGLTEIAEELGLSKDVLALFSSEFEESDLGLIPKGWKVKATEKLAEKIAMGPFGSNIKVSTFVDAGVPIISGQHLKEPLVTDQEHNFITDSHANKLENSIVYSGDIIFTHAGNIGQVSLIPKKSKYKKYVISQRQFYLRPKEGEVFSSFLVYFFRSPIGQHKLLSNASQVGVPSIARPSSHLKSIELIVPSFDVMKKFDDICSNIIDKIITNREQNQTLIQLRDTLLPKLLSGEITIESATDLVKSAA